MSPQDKSHLDVFTTYLLIPLISGFLWLFWANLFVLITPNLDLPLVDVELSRQIEMIVFCPTAITLGISAIIPARSVSNPRLENFVIWFTLSIFLALDPLIEIIKELSKDKDIFLILDKRPDITSSLSSAIAVSILLIGIAVIKKIKINKK